MARRRKDINLLRVIGLLQAHISAALCRAVFGQVRKMERKRAWNAVRPGWDNSPLSGVTHDFLRHVAVLRGT